MRIEIIRATGESISRIQLDTISDNTDKIINICAQLIEGNKCPVEDLGDVNIGSYYLADLLAFFKAKNINFDLNQIYNDNNAFFSELIRTNIERINTIM